MKEIEKFIKRQMRLTTIVGILMLIGGILLNAQTDGSVLSVLMSGLGCMIGIGGFFLIVKVFVILIMEKPAEKKEKPQKSKRKAKK